MTTLINKPAVNKRSCQWHFQNDPNLSVWKWEVEQMTLPYEQIPAIAKKQSSISTEECFVQFLSSSPNDRATSDGGGVATFWCEQCAMTTFVRLLKTRSATSIVKDWQLWAIRAWIAHCARAPQSGSTIHQQPHWPWTKAHVDAVDDNDADEVFLRHRIKWRIDSTIY